MGEAGIADESFVRERWWKMTATVVPVLATPPPSATEAEGLLNELDNYLRLHENFAGGQSVQDAAKRLRIALNQRRDEILAEASR